jgi:hypothetical protein
MADRMTNVEFLIMLAEDVRVQGDEFSHETRTRGQAQYDRLYQLSLRLDEARDMVTRELQRFSHFAPTKGEVLPQPQMPRGETQMPRVVAKGPRTAEGS